ncbi:MAG: glycoside hydrolase family 113 [Acidimicrobiales bacterium]
MQQGIDFAGWSTDAFSTPGASSSLRALARTGATWVSVVVEQYQSTADSTTILPTKQTVSDAGLTSIVEQAHALHLNVALKPQIDVVNGAFRGTIGTTFTPAQWSAWFGSYRTFISHYATLAQSLGVQQLVIGTELTQASSHAPQWRSLISTVRSAFSGSLTYAANYGSEVQDITWWNDLSYIGVDAYYPLDSSEPNYGWSPYVAELAALSKQWHKQVLLTEIGYRSVAGAPSEPWNFNLSGPADTATQNGAYAAAFRAFAAKRWFAGMYWWVWSPQIPNGSNDDGYSPQNKPAEKQLRTWYGAERP